jgi:hypothetical protein
VIASLRGTRTATPTNVSPAVPHNDLLTAILGDLLPHRYRAAVHTASANTRARLPQTAYQAPERPSARTFWGHPTPPSPPPFRSLARPSSSDPEVVNANVNVDISPNTTYSSPFTTSFSPDRLPPAQSHDAKPLRLTFSPLTASPGRVWSRLVRRRRRRLRLRLL